MENVEVPSAPDLGLYRASAYTSRIIKAGALLPDIWTLLLSWDTALTGKENLQRARQENLLGKASRSRVEDVLAIFRQRFFADPTLAESLAILAQAGWNKTALNRLLYFFSVRSDRLLHDMVTDVLVPMFRANRLAVEPQEIEARIQQWVAEGKTTASWSDETVRRVSQGVLSTLRDFEVLSGKVLKRIDPPFLPSEAAAFLAFLLIHEGVGPADLTAADYWNLFFLDAVAVERLLLEAHQQHLLSYYAAGQTVRVDFPAETLAEYARALS